MFERDHIREIEGYVPSVQPAAGAIKLNTNENPYPPSPRAMAALGTIRPEMLQRYPDPLSEAFRQVAARTHGLTMDQVVATNAGDELLKLALTTFADPGRPVGVVSPSYGLYSVLAALHQAPLSEVALTEAWQLPERTAERWNEDRAQIAFLTNPHAPSGTLIPAKAIERLAATFQGVLVIDEAYVDFVDPALNHDATPLISRYPNVLLLRTMSKAYSLAGLRLGYGLGDPALLEPILAKTKDSYNIDAVAQLVGAAALQDSAYALATWEMVGRERTRLAHALSDIGLPPLPSQTNFLLATSFPSNRGITARDVYAELVERNIYVRWFDTPRLRDKLRITIGTPDENDALLIALREILHQTANHPAMSEAHPASASPH